MSMDMNSLNSNITRGKSMPTCSIIANEFSGGVGKGNLD